jgi:hypothetical protein
MVVVRCGDPVLAEMLHAAQATALECATQS